MVKILRYASSCQRSGEADEDDMNDRTARTLATLHETLRVKRELYLGAVERKNAELAAFEEVAILRLEEAIQRIEQVYRAKVARQAQPQEAGGE